MMNSRQIEVYLSEIDKHCEYGVISCVNCKNILERGSLEQSEISEIQIATRFAFHSARAVVTSSAMVSKMLWNGPLRKKKEESSGAFKVREEFAKDRSQLLRDLLGVDDDSVLHSRNLRNYIEHFDELLDERLASTGAIVLDTIGSEWSVTVDGAPADYLNRLDYSNGDFTILSETVNIQSLAEAMQKLGLKAQSELVRRNPGLWGPRFKFPEPAPVESI